MSDPTASYVQARIEHEENALSNCVVAALTALAWIAKNDEHDVEHRIDAASRVLAYASSIPPDDSLDDEALEAIFGDDGEEERPEEEC